MNRLQQRGFTLVELIVVMVVVGILAGGMVVFFVPAIQNYVAVNRRAGLTDMMDGAIRTISRDVRSAVPNSIRLPANSCFQLVPTSTGGRFRTADDTTTAGSAALTTVGTTNQFDVYNTLSTTPSIGDWVVINNQNTSDVYDGVNRVAISGVADISATGFGAQRITLANQFQAPGGYEFSRFVVVPQAQQSVFYVCSNAGLSNGSGTGTLYRIHGYPFAGAANACPAPGNNPILATNVAACTFTYDPSSQQSTGYLQVQLTLTQNNESVQIVFGTHADNIP